MTKTFTKDWLTVTYDNEKGSLIIKFLSTLNTSNESRNVSLTLKSGILSKSITIVLLGTNLSVIYGDNIDNFFLYSTTSGDKHEISSLNNEAVYIISSEGYILGDTVLLNNITCVTDSSSSIPTNILEITLEDYNKLSSIDENTLYLLKTY